MATHKATIGERIRDARTARGWKQKHLAAEVSVEPITVSRWERGATSPDLDVLRLVADATGKPLGFFLEEGERRPDRLPLGGELADAVTRIEAAAGRLADSAERIEIAVAELRRELGRG